MFNLSVYVQRYIYHTSATVTPESVASTVVTLLPMTSIRILLSIKTTVFPQVT